MMLKILTKFSVSNFIIPHFGFNDQGTDIVDEKLEKTYQLKKELKRKYGNLYDLSLVKYLTSRTPIQLICSKHGVFQQHYMAHLHEDGGGCRQCRQEDREKALIAQFRKVHGERYDYSAMVIERTRVSVKCREHGEFWVTASSHASSESAGCQRCRMKEQEDKLIKQFKEVHGNKYDYSQMNFSKSTVKVSICCPEHGLFKQLPTAHKSGQGCPKCVGRLEIDDLIKMFNEVHANKYIYIDLETTKKRSKINIECSRHGVFVKTIESHLNGIGCPHCLG